MMKLFTVLFASLFPLALGAETPEPPRAGQGEVRADFSYFSTKANYGQDGGTASDLPFGASLESMMIEGLFLFDWRPDWRFGAGANYAFVETDDGNFARSNSGANEFLMHAQKWFELGPLDIVPQVDFAYPFFRVDENADDAVYGEGAMRTALGSWIFYPLRGLKPFAFVGAQHRDEGRSLIVPYAAGVRFQSGGWWFLGEARGYQTVMDDDDTDDRDRRQDFLANVNGGSQRFYAVNPSVVEGAFELGARFGSWRARTGAALTVNGASAAEGFTVTAGVSYVMGGLTSTRTPEAPTRDRFEFRRERYDEEIFEDDVTPRTPIEPSIVPAPPTAKPAETPKKRPPRKKKGKSIDKLINDTENALEDR